MSRTAPKLREYQVETVKAASKALANGARAPLVVAQTGAGKTVIGAEIVRLCSKGGKRTLWLVHRDELLAQTREKLLDAGLERVGCIGAKWKQYSDQDAQAQVATVQTLLSRGLRPEAYLVIFDEAHHYRSAQWGELADSYSGSIRIGLTATPERADGSALGDLFDHMIVATSYSTLIEAGHLAPCEVVTPSREGRGLACLPAEAWNKYSAGRPGVVFAATVDAAAAASEQIEHCRHIHGGSSHQDRANAISLFDAGLLDCLSNCAVLTEGWDSPRCEVAVLGRKCDHVSQYLQIAGRILRPSPGKTIATLVDLTGCFARHGYPTEDRDYSLTGKAISRREKEQRVWLCRRCGYSLTAAPRDRKCPACGNETTIKTPDMEERELSVAVYTCECGAKHRTIPIVCASCGSRTHKGKKLMRESPEERAHYLEKLHEQASRKGYKRGWIYYKYLAKYGEAPPAEH